MTTAAAHPHPAHDGPEPAWDVALLFPPQGQWSENEYLTLTGLTNRLVELVDGNLEVLPMPTLSHQRLVLYLCNLLNAFAKPRELGEAIPAGYPVRLRERTFREPDVVFVKKENAGRFQEQFAESFDLAMEIVSEGGRKRDLKDKRQDYAKAGVSEYWIVDPRERTIAVLKLADDQYVEHGVFREGETARSALLDGFEVDVAATFAAARAAE